MIRLFNLVRPEGAGRAGKDAELVIGRKTYSFELKSTSNTGRNVTTVRDFGPDHIKKWREKHWIFGFYDRSGQTLEYCCYGSPRAMAPWIQEKERYISPDFTLVGLLPGHIGEAELFKVLGKKERYTYEDAKGVQKMQYSADEYRSRMDLPDGYSVGRMVEILRDRARYLLERGSTLNNPHIPGSYFESWEKITRNHAARLRALMARERQS